MNTLLAQQRALQGAIVSEQPTAQLLRSLPGRAPLLHIYQHAYRARLIGALRDNFGVLPQVMGDETFDALALAYIDAQPSREPSIRWFGHRLAEFMAAHDELVAHPALIDLARMEWALRNAFDAADAPVLLAAELGAVSAADWLRLVFDAMPGLQLLELHWAVEPVWRALQSAEPGEEPELPEPVAHAHTLLVWRRGLENKWRVLDDQAAALLHAVRDGRDFSSLCEIAASQVGEGDAAARVVGALQGWLADELLRGVRVVQAA